MINNINSYSGNFTFNSSTAPEIDEIIEAHKNPTNSTVETSSSVKENFYLSSRAQKINAISTEFFNNGSIQFNDVDALKERAYQLGLISKQEYVRLTDTELANSYTQKNADVSSQTLADFADDFIQRLDKAGVENDTDEGNSQSLLTLIEALTTAKTILSDVDSAKNEPNFKESLKTTLTSIREAISADTFEIIPLDDKVAISKLHQALEIVDKIIPERLSNAKVNQYIKVSLT